MLCNWGASYLANRHEPFYTGDPATKNYSMAMFNVQFLERVERAGRVLAAGADDAGNTRSIAINFQFCTNGS